MAKIIGIGHKARNGKDLFATIFKKLIPNSYIIHWAKGVYTETQNNINNTPLIIKQDNYTLFKQLDGKYEIIDNFIPNNEYYYNLFNTCTYLTIPPMKDKNPNLLQLWGTDYRRQQNSNYWIKFLDKELQALIYNFDYILIPDTRFKNEYQYIKDNNGIYIKIRRIKDGKYYIDPNRDTNHISEVDLEDIQPDYSFDIIENDFSAIEQAIKSII